MQANAVNGGIAGASDANSAWETLQPNQANTVNLGGIVTTTTQDASSLKPSSVTVNGVTCALS